MAQRSKALHLSARGVTTDTLVRIQAALQPGRKWDSQWAAHNLAQCRPGLAVIVNKYLFLTDLPS